jgi:hypothetical protein
MKGAFLGQPYLNDIEPKTQLKLRFLFSDRFIGQAMA